MDEYLTTKQAAERMKVPKSTLMGWIYDSKIRATRKGRYWYLHVSDVDARAAARAAA